MSKKHQDKVVAILARLGTAFEIVQKPDSVDAKIKRGNWECYAWRLRFRRSRISEEFDYFTGTGRVKTTGRHVSLLAPTPADLLYSLQLDGAALDLPFQHRCEEYNGDSDSIKDFDTYRKCCEIGTQLSRLFSRAERDELAETLEGF
jgi:hypothetical protein